MNINFTQNDLSEEELSIIRDIFNDEKFSDLNINDLIGLIAKASLEEYLQMILGRGIPTRADEIKENRLRIIILNIFKDCLPSEVEISKIFHIPQSQGKSMLRKTMSRYPYEISNHIKNSLKKILDTGEKHYESDRITQYVTLIIDSSLELDMLNDICAEIQSDSQAIKKISGTIKQYKILPTPYNNLCDYLSYENRIRFDNE